MTQALKNTSSALMKVLNAGSRRKFVRRLFAGLAGTGLAATGVAAATPDPKTNPSSARGADPLLAEIMIFGGNFAPRGWAFCDGQTLSISAYSALFSLLGTTYGGDGRTTFGLPDLRGRVPIHAGTGTGLTNRRLGQRGGQETVTLTESQIPSHTHTTTTAVTVNNAGGGQSHNNMQPYLTLNFCIALQGTFPSRS